MDSRSTAHDTCMQLCRGITHHDFITCSMSVPLLMFVKGMQWQQSSCLTQQELRTI